jgi:ATP-dependent Lon protease
MLDEIDKIGIDFRGDPASALLEVLDPEQNVTFSDHYLSVPFDLSQVMFITTANLLEPITPVLRDRMEVIDLPGYTNREKLMIAKRYLVSRQLTENGIDAKRLNFKDAALAKIISDYTREAGVRNVEREIAKVCRKVATEVAQGKRKKTILTKELVPSFLGPERFVAEAAERRDDFGVATGVAWTSVGGTILFVEAVAMPGKGGLVLTGSLGQVMKESAQAALSLVRSRAEGLGVEKEFFANNEFHIHVPAGATPKDGPSAGVTIFASLCSLVTKKRTAHDVAMTGEITLRGRVLPVGGIRQKAHAAHRAGLKKLIVPAKNENDIRELPADVQKQLQVVFVETVDEVLEHALRNNARQGRRSSTKGSGRTARKQKGRYA